jgi:hypothetical protein
MPEKVELQNIDKHCEYVYEALLEWQKVALGNNGIAYVKLLKLVHKAIQATQAQQEAIYAMLEFVD